MTRYTRRQREWGGAAWTDPIPTHERVQGTFAMWPWRSWTLAENSRTGEVFRLRPDRDHQWAEIDHVA